MFFCGSKPARHSPALEPGCEHGAPEGRQLLCCTPLLSVLPPTTHPTCPKEKRELRPPGLLGFALGQHITCEPGVNSKISDSAKFQVLEIQSPYLSVPKSVPVLALGTSLPKPRLKWQSLGHFLEAEVRLELELGYFGSSRKYSLLLENIPRQPGKSC